MTARQPLTGESGEVGIIRLVGFLLVAALLVYEVGAVMVNSLQLDDQAQQALLAVQRVSNPRQDSVAAAAVAAVDPSVTVDAVELSTTGVTVQVSRQAGTIVLGRVEPLRGFTEGTVTKTRQFN